MMLFSTSLLILINSCLTISKERRILERDFESGLSRLHYVFFLLLFNAIYAMIETFFFFGSLVLSSRFFNVDIPKADIRQILVTILLMFISVHFLGLFISSICGESSSSSVIYSGIVGIGQFVLSGTIIELPDSIETLSNLTFLSFAHKNIMGIFDIGQLPSALESFQVIIPKEELDLFKSSTSVLIKNEGYLLLHLVLYLSLFAISIQFYKNLKRLRKKKCFCLSEAFLFSASAGFRDKIKE